MTESPHPVRLRAVVLGEGRPKICVPLVASTVEGLELAASALPRDVVDLVELRIDYFDGVDDDDAVAAAIDAVHAGLGDETPLLFTFRSKPEGGQRDIDPDRYVELALLAASTPGVDAVDVEMFTELGPLERIVNGVHERGSVVVMSSHDFQHTPSEEQIVARLLLQQDLGADIVKIAVMPESPRDVLTLLAATERYVTTKGVRPAITMAMGPLGLVTRLAGETFGSSVTFGAVGSRSAPGQIDATALRGVLDVIHEAR